MPTVKVNGNEVTVPAGTNMIQAAELAGVEIPHFCYHQDLSVAGNCRMCLVDVEAGGRGPDIACNMVARDGLAIRTDSDNVDTMRRSVLEFMLKNHPLDCPICDQSGECTLQDHYAGHGAEGSRLRDEKHHKPKRSTLSDKITLDAERCIACSRCVRFGDEITGTSDLRLFERTDHTEIGIFPGAPIAHEYQGNLVDICPVGALTSTEFRFQKRVWYLKSTDSICSGCATGCNIRVEHQSGEIFRFKPRRNPEVNSSWMCDSGRATWSASASFDRLLTASVGGARADFAAAAAEAASLLDGKKVAVVLGNGASNEANYAAALLAGRLGGKLFHLEGNEPGAAEGGDELLMDADKSPNRKGAALAADTAGGAAGGDALKAAISAGEVEVAVVLQDDAAARLEGLSLPVVYIGTWANSTSKGAEVVLPAAAHVEQDGSFVNRHGRVQRFRRAVFPAGDSLPAHRVIEQIAVAMGGSLLPATSSALFAAFAAAHPAMEGFNHRNLGSEGRTLHPDPSISNGDASASSK